MRLRVTRRLTTLPLTRLIMRSEKPSHSVHREPHGTSAAEHLVCDSAKRSVVQHTA
jgi:hypothetical protein